MKKIIRLTESDLTRIIKRVIKESTQTLPDGVKPGDQSKEGAATLLNSWGWDDHPNNFPNGVFRTGFNYAVTTGPDGKSKIPVPNGNYIFDVDIPSSFGVGSVSIILNNPIKEVLYENDNSKFCKVKIINGKIDLNNTFGNACPRNIKDNSIYKILVRPLSK
jgi:hypothetical protein